MASHFFFYAKNCKCSQCNISHPHCSQVDKPVRLRMVSPTKTQKCDIFFQSHVASILRNHVFFSRQILFLHMKTKAKFTGILSTPRYFWKNVTARAWIAYVLLPFFLQHPIQRGTITYREENFQTLNPITTSPHHDFQKPQ